MSDGRGPGARPPGEDEFPDYAEDDGLIRAVAGDRVPRRRVYRLPRPVVVLGRGSKPQGELHLTACRADGIPVLRRRGGGCAVVVDPGNLVVSLVRPAPTFGDNVADFRRLSAWVCAALARAGVAGVGREGTSDLVLGERKVGGASIHRGRGLLYYSVTLLVTPDVRLMERYLRHPPREPAYRRGRSHAEFVGALRPGADEDGIERLRGQLEAELAVEEAGTDG